MRRAIIVAVAVVATLVASAVDHGQLQHWLAVHLGLLKAGPDVYYNFWSGSGSDLGEITLFTGVFLAWRHHVCHVKGCPWLGKAVDGTPYVACPRHHPEHEGHRRSVSLETIHEAWRRRGQSAGAFTLNSQTTGNLGSFAFFAATQTTTKENTMSLLDSIEARFRALPKLFSSEVTDAEKLAHSTVAQKAEAFVKDVLPLLPDGSAAEEFVKRVQEGVAWAHSALDSAVSAAEKPAEAAVVDASSAVASTEAAVAASSDAVSAATDAPAQAETAVPAAPAEAPAPEAAPAADATAPVTWPGGPAQSSDATAATDTPAPATDTTPPATPSA